MVVMKATMLTSTWFESNTAREVTRLTRNLEWRSLGCKLHAVPVQGWLRSGGRLPGRVVIDRLGQKPTRDVIRSLPPGALAAQKLPGHTSGRAIEVMRREGSM